MSIAPKGELIDLSESIKNVKSEKERVETLTKMINEVKEHNEKEPAIETVKHIKFNYTKKDGTKRPVVMKPLTIDGSHLKGIDWDRTEKDEIEHHKQRTFILASIS